ncbi:ChaN family lipoprotein [Desulfocurvus sp. DL9XJH121]
MLKVSTLLRLLAVGLAFALAGCAGGPMPRPMRDVLPGEIFAPKGQVQTLESVARAARGADYVLLGEGHAVACDHLVQADVLRAVARAGMSPALGLEMVSVDRQPVLDRFNAGELDLDGLRDALDWDKTWGHAFSGYAPVLRVAREAGVPLVALNVPRRVVRAVSEGGLEAVAPEDRAQAPPEILPPPDGQRESLREEFAMHRELMAPKDAESKEAEHASALRLERFLQVQSLWDTAMAEGAVAARRLGSPVVVLVGAGHVEYGWGLAHRLKSLDPGAKVLSLVPWRGLDDPDYAAADLLFYCALTNSSRLGFELRLLPGAAEVLSVAPGTKAEAAGFRPGDAIVAAQGEAVQDLWVLHKAAVRAKRDGKPLEFSVRRGEALLTLTVPLTPDPMDSGKE